MRLTSLAFMPVIASCHSGVLPSTLFTISSKPVVNFGHNLFEGIVIADAKKLAKFAASKDTKLLVLEPRFSVVASKAD